MHAVAEPDDLLRVEVPPGRDYGIIDTSAMSRSRPPGHEPRDCTLSEIHRPHVWTRARPGAKPCWCEGKGYDEAGRPFRRHD